MSGAQWLSWKSVRLENESCWFETHGLQSQCAMFLSKTLYLLLSAGSTQEDRKLSNMTEKLLTGT